MVEGEYVELHPNTPSHDQLYTMVPLLEVDWRLEGVRPVAQSHGVLRVIGTI